MTGFEAATCRVENLPLFQKSYFRILLHKIVEITLSLALMLELYLIMIAMLELEL